jgi:outer membrane protein
MKEPIKKLNLFIIPILLTFCQSCLSMSPEMQDIEYQSSSSQQIEFKGKVIQDNTSTEKPVLKNKEITGPIEVTLEDAILMMLENNRSLMVESMEHPISKTYESEAEAAFDPVLSSGADYSRNRAWSQTRSMNNTSSDVNSNVGVTQSFPIGTEVSAGLRAGRSWSDLYSNQYDTRLGLTLTQALLRGKSVDVNLADIRQRRLDTRITDYEFRGFAQSLVAQVEETYWDYALAMKRIEIYQESLRLAEKQHNETEELISVGMLPEKEITAAKAEIAFRRQGLIDAKSNLEKIRLRFIRLLNPAGSNYWDRDVIIKELPSVPDVKMDEVKEYVDLSFQLRPELNRARLGIQRNELEIVKTRNGLLPKMDFFIDLGRTGYADSFGRSLEDLGEDHYDYTVGLQLQYEIGKRRSEAKDQRAMLQQEQAKESVENLTQLIEMEVRQAYIEVNRSREQISASRETLKLQEEKLDIEREKFKVGKSTILNVAQAQRDLLQSRIDEVQAVVNYIKSLLELYRLDGSLLERRGISAPGSEPVL